MSSTVSSVETASVELRLAGSALRGGCVLRLSGRVGAIGGREVPLPATDTPAEQGVGRENFWMHGALGGATQVQGKKVESVRIGRLRPRSHMGRT